MLRDDNVIDFTQINKDKVYIVMAVIGGNKSYIHFGVPEKGKPEQFFFDSKFKGSCQFDKHNADGVANMWRTALPDTVVNVMEVEYNKKTKVWVVVENDNGKV